MTRRARWTAIVILLGVAACDSPTKVDVVGGSYTLVSVDGASLPATLSDTASEKVVITGGTLDLNQDNRCLLNRDFVTTSGGATTTTHDSTPCGWSRTGSAIFLTIDGSGAVPGTVNESTGVLVFNLGGHALEFGR